MDEQIVVRAFLKRTNYCRCRNMVDSQKQYVEPRRKTHESVDAV